MTDRTSKNENESPSKKNKMKPITKRNLKKNLLYGMTPEQYHEGIEVHCKCFETVEKLTLELIQEQAPS